MFRIINIVFLPLALSFFTGNLACAQSSAESKQSSIAEARKRSLEIAVNHDIARFDSIVPLSPGQRSLLKESFTDIEAKKYTDTPAPGPNKTDMASLDNEIYKQEVDELEDVLRPKQLKVWNERNKTFATAPPSTAGTH